MPLVARPLVPWPWEQNCSDQRSRESMYGRCEARTCRCSVRPVCLCTLLCKEEASSKIGKAKLPKTGSSSPKILKVLTCCLSPALPILLMSRHAPRRIRSWSRIAGFTFIWSMVSHFEQALRDCGMLSTLLPGFHGRRHVPRMPRRGKRIKLTKPAALKQSHHPSFLLQILTSISKLQSAGSSLLEPLRKPQAQALQQDSAMKRRPSTGMPQRWCGLAWLTSGNHRTGAFAPSSRIRQRYRRRSEASALRRLWCRTKYLAELRDSFCYIRKHSHRRLCSCFFAQHSTGTSPRST